MAQLPNVTALAKTKPELVLKLWEGLGYYSRARNLQKAAQIIVRDYGGKFPENFHHTIELPGIGRYTAGAICSIAFNQPTPILDGNVIRVLTRLFGITGEPRDKLTGAQLWRLAAELVSVAARTSSNGGPKCSHFNQALMELGALICTPALPKCHLCPLRSQCVAYGSAQVAALPNLTKRTPSMARRFVTFIAEHRGRFLVRQRPAGVVNAHLWEFPNAEVTTASPPLRKTARMILNAAPVRLQPLCVIKHTITRYRITLEAYRADFKQRVMDRPKHEQWLTLPEINALPFASAHRKIVRVLLPVRRKEPRRAHV